MNVWTIALLLLAVVIFIVVILVAMAFVGRVERPASRAGKHGPR